MNYIPYIPPKVLQPIRPGSEDANKVPSLENGKRIPYKPPVAQCVGTKEYAG